MVNNMAKKAFYISDDNEQILEQLKTKLGFTTYSQVINYLLAKEKEEPEQRIAIAVRKELEENYLQKERTRWAVQTAEQNSIILLDAINTILHKEQLTTCIGCDFAPSSVITQSRKNLKDKIQHFKQKSDERKQLKK